VSPNPQHSRRPGALLERLLAEEGVQVGDFIKIAYFGKRRTADGERQYRHYLLEVRDG
jgi:hypothetical protein